MALDASHGDTRPRSTRVHLFGAETRTYALDVESGRILPLAPGTAKSVRTSLKMRDTARAEMMALGLGRPRIPDLAPPRTVPLKALSLAIAQKCNLGCTYCYAQQGTFGGASATMPDVIAKASVDRLLADAAKGETVTLAFMGGEPLTNRRTLHDTTHYAAQAAADKGVGIGFSLTTNATLIRPKDVALFQRFGFTLTISVDGLKANNDKLRPFAGGRGSFEHVKRSLSRLTAVENRRFDIHARVTVTPLNLDLPEILLGLTELGFDGIMFSPMLSAPSGNGEMGAERLDQMLRQLIECGDLFRAGLREGRVIPFTNVLTNLKRIRNYQRDHYPCGAGGGYMGVSAKGGLYSCHRFVDDDTGHLGNVGNGVVPDKQAAWLARRNLSEQLPCTTCWARHLCAGSCHYEVIKRGRPACDYIRGWLHHCLGLYAELAQDQPETLRRILARP